MEYRRFNANAPNIQVKLFMNGLPTYGVFCAKSFSAKSRVSTSYIMMSGYVIMVIVMCCVIWYYLYK